MYKTVKYNSSAEALEAFRKMVERKKAWIEQTEHDFTFLRHQQIANIVSNKGWNPFEVHPGS